MNFDQFEQIFAKYVVGFAKIHLHKIVLKMAEIQKYNHNLAIMCFYESQINNIPNNMLKTDKIVKNIENNDKISLLEK